MYDVINQIDEKPFRNDVVKKDGKEPEAIRYHFYQDNMDGRQLIKRIFKALTENLNL